MFALKCNYTIIHVCDRTLTESVSRKGRDTQRARERFLPLACPSPHFSEPLNIPLKKPSLIHLLQLCFSVPARPAQFDQYSSAVFPRSQKHLCVRDLILKPSSPTACLCIYWGTKIRMGLWLILSSASDWDQWFRTGYLKPIKYLTLNHIHFNPSISFK